MAFGEVLVAPSQHVRWVRVSGKFSLQTLGARPVDVSDPPGNAHQRWLGGHYFISPWLIRSIEDEERVQTVDCVEHRGKLDVTCRTLLQTF